MNNGEKKLIDRMLDDLDNDIELKYCVEWIVSSYCKDGYPVHQAIYDIVSKDIYDERLKDWMKYGVVRKN